MSKTALPNVYAPEDLVWHETDLEGKLWTSDELIGPEYSSLFSAQLAKFGPGGGSATHHHDYNHAFYFLTGTARVQIGDRSWHTKPGSFVKVPASAAHSVTNTDDADLVFLVIYDPPHGASD